MKKKLLNLTTLLLLFFSCITNDDGTTSNLPDLTNEGKNTFGCKINEQVFLPRDSGGLNINDAVPILKALYVYSEYDFNGYRLSIFADNEVLRKSIHIEMTGSQTALEEGEIYPIIIKENDNIHATYNFFDIEFPKFNKYNTTNEISGELEIVKLDTENQIISGTFWFNCEEVNNGEILEIRQGRFDITYTTSF